MTNLTTRVLVAFVAIPLVVFVTLAGGLLFFVFVAAVSTLALMEFYRLAAAKGIRPQAVSGVMFGLCVNAAFLHHTIQYGLAGAFDSAGIGIPFPSMTQLILIVILVFLPLIFMVEIFRNTGNPLSNIAVTVVGVCYVSLFLGTLIGLRELFLPGDFPLYRYFDTVGPDVPPDLRETVYRWGGWTVVAVFASIWTCDTAAYFVGTAFGRHKLLPRISPNKTWEGALAGLAGAVAAFVVGQQMLLPYLSVGSAVICGLLVGVFGQAGDLVESQFKRDAGVKDSSSFIPGHGGVLDRFDSLIFVSPVLFLYLDFIVF